MSTTKIYENLMDIEINMTQARLNNLVKIKKLYKMGKLTIDQVHALTTDDVSMDTNEAHRKKPSHCDMTKLMILPHMVTDETTTAT